jgi:hypothetical protein
MHPTPLPVMLNLKQRNSFIWQLKITWLAGQEMLHLMASVKFWHALGTQALF